MAKYIRSRYQRLQTFYDDDGRRVKTVYVSNIREGSTSESLEKKYSVYGPVRSCALEYHTDSDELYAVITMDYAFDASKIMRDWPLEVKPSYSLLPKRVCRNLGKNSAEDLPTIRNTKSRTILEEPIGKTHQQKVINFLTSSAGSENVQSEPCTSHNDKMGGTDSLENITKDRVNQNEARLKETAVPVRRRRHAAAPIASKAKKRIVEKTKIEEPVHLQTQPSSENLKRELSTSSNAHIQTDSRCSTSPNSAPASEDVQSNPFTSLNDDCLLSIFAFCDKFDLARLALVCERFRFIVYHYLRAGISKIVDLRKMKPYDRLTLYEATKFLQFIDAVQNMQHLGLTMSAFCENNDQLILEKILNSCGPNLRRITFTGFCFVEGFVPKWKHLFKELEWLTFSQCTFSTNHFNTLLNFCENLEVLNVNGSTSIGFEDDIKHDLPLGFKCNKLKEFRLISSRRCGESSELLWLLDNNPNLRILQILDIGNSVKLTGEILQRLGQLRQMQDLAFSFENIAGDVIFNLHHLLRLKELKSLSLQCDWMNISKFIKELSLAANRQIESLSLEYIDIDISFLRAIGKFRNLKFLKLENTVVNEFSQEVFEQSLMDLTYRLNSLTNFQFQSHLFTEDSLVQFVDRMKKLRHLQISGLVMNLILFMRFVSVCERRVNGLKLNLVVDNYRYLTEYLDMLRSGYGKMIQIQSLYD